MSFNKIFPKITQNLLETMLCVEMFNIIYMYLIIISRTLDFNFNKIIYRQLYVEKTTLFV